MYLFYIGSKHIETDMKELQKMSDIHRYLIQGSVYKGFTDILFTWILLKEDKTTITVKMQNISYFDNEFQYP